MTLREKLSWESDIRRNIQNLKLTLTYEVKKKKKKLCHSPILISVKGFCLHLSVSSLGH